MTAFLAFAHPGHGHTVPTSWAHYLTEPIHVTLLVTAVIVVVLVWRGLRHARTKNP